MQYLRFFACLLSIGLTGGATGVAWAQNYPAKPIRVVTSTPGGGADFVARILAQRLSTGLGQQLIVENRNGILAAEVVAKAPPDGYTLLVTGSVLWLTPFLQEHVAYDPVKDFSPVALTNVTPNVLVVHPSLPVKSAKEFITLARSKPGQLSYAAGAIGSPNHLAGELLKAMAGVNILAVPYKGIGPALNAVAGGEVVAAFSNPGSVMPLAKAGRLRALAVTSARPSSLAPELPTMASAGLPGYESSVLYGMLAPAKTPAALVSRLNQEIVRQLNAADIKEKLFQSGMETIAGSPEEFAATIKADMARLGKVIKDAGIRAD